MAGYDNSFFQTIRGNDPRARRQKTPQELAEEARQQALGMQGSDLDLRRRMAQQSSIDARASQEAGFAQQSRENAANRTAAERQAWISQGLMPPSTGTGTAKPAAPQPDPRLAAYHDFQRKEVEAKKATGWRPSITYGGETVTPDASGRIRATPSQMRYGEMRAQESQLADQQKSNIRGMDYFQRMVGALRTPVESMNNTQMSPEQAVRGVQLDQAAGGMNRESGDVWRDQQVIARRDAAMLPQFRAQQEQTSALAQDTAAGRLSPENEAALASRMGDAGYQPIAEASVPQAGPAYRDVPQRTETMFPGNREAMAANEQALATPTPQVGVLRPGGELGQTPQRGAWDVLANPFDIQAQASPQQPAQAQPAPQFDAVRKQLYDDYQKRLADIQQQQQAPQSAAPQVIPGGVADQRRLQVERQRQQMDLERQGGQRALQGGTEAIAGRVKTALDDVGAKAKTTDEGIAGIGNALSLAQSESDIVDAQQALYQSSLYTTAPAEVRAYIDALIYNARAAKAGMPAKPLPPKPQMTYYDLRNAPSNMGPAKWDTEMITAG